MRLVDILKFAVLVVALAFLGCDDDGDDGGAGGAGAAGGAGGAGAAGGAGGAGGEGGAGAAGGAGGEGGAGAAGGAGGEGGAGAAGGAGGEGGAGAAGGAGGAGGGETPAMPEMAAVQIDRAGRSAVSTALVATFNPDPDAKNAAKDAYNAAAPADWAAQADGLAGSMAIYDALDTVCGNQALFSAETGYAGLAGVLADDRLWVNLMSDSCGVYLGVEANATGLVPNNDCGGRRPIDDSIDPTLSVLAVGMAGGVSDGVDADDVDHGSDFPWLAAPTE